MSNKNNSNSSSAPPTTPDDEDLGRHALTITITAALYERGIHVTASSTSGRTGAAEERLKAAVVNELIRMNDEAQARYEQQQQQQQQPS